MAYVYAEEVIGLNSKIEKEIELSVSHLNASIIPFSAPDFEADNVKDGIIEAKGGGGSDVKFEDVLAAEYDEDREGYYPKGSYVLYDEKLYIANQEVPQGAGPFKLKTKISDYDATKNYPPIASSTVVYEGKVYHAIQFVPAGSHLPTDTDYWAEDTVVAFNPESTYATDTIVSYEDKFYYANDAGRTGLNKLGTFTEGTTYYYGTIVVYEDEPYMCVSAGEKSEWDPSDWSEVEYTVWTDTKPSSLINKVGEDFYQKQMGYTGDIGTVGEFDPSKWTNTKACDEIKRNTDDECKIGRKAFSLTGCTTDATGAISLSGFINQLPLGSVIITAYINYTQMTMATGYVLIRTSSLDFKVYEYDGTAGEYVPAANVEFLAADNLNISFIYAYGYVLDE